MSLRTVVNSKDYCGACSRRTDRNHFLNKKLLPIWYNKDGQPQYHVPDVLEKLTHAEKMLIQKVSPFIPLHHIKHGIMGLSGHVCAFEQDIGSVATVLPRCAKDATLIRVLQETRTEIGDSTNKSTRAFNVRRESVLNALRFLKDFNIEYKNIVIDDSRLDWINGD